MVLLTILRFDMFQYIFVLYMDYICLGEKNKTFSNPLCLYQFYWRFCSASVFFSCNFVGTLSFLVFFHPNTFIFDWEQLLLKKKIFLGEIFLGKIFFFTSNHLRIQLPVLIKCRLYFSFTRKKVDFPPCH